MKKSFYIITLLVLAVLFTGTSYAQFPKYLYGVISIFNDDYAGKTTASGETYDPDQLTAAHQTLPFGTEMLIENLENGRKATVRIIDRGPLSDSRIMEVSREAADRLGFIKKGTVYTKITLVKIGDNRMKTPTPLSSAAASKSSAAPVEAAAEPEIPALSVSSAPSAVKTEAVIPPSSVQPKVNVITKTNMATLYETNLIEVTNYNDLTVTNQVEIPPYEEKYIEQPLEERKIPDMAAIQDEFILDEPVENVTVKENKTETAVAPEPELPVPEEKNSAEIEVPVEKAQELNTDEYGGVPETLSSNEEAVNIEKSESQGEALLESGKQKGNYNLVVQAGAFRKEGNALRFYETLKNKGFDVFTSEVKIRGKKWFRVRVGYFNSMESARQAISKLKKMKIKAFLVKIKK